MILWRLVRTASAAYARRQQWAKRIFFLCGERALQFVVWTPCTITRASATSKQGARSDASPFATPNSAHARRPYLSRQQTRALVCKQTVSERRHLSASYRNWFLSKLRDQLRCLPRFTATSAATRTQPETTAIRNQGGKLKALSRKQKDRGKEIAAEMWTRRMPLVLTESSDNVSFDCSSLSLLWGEAGIPSSLSNDAWEFD